MTASSARSCGDYSGWLKDKRRHHVITGERGDGLLTKQGLEEHVSTR
jgi:hypothetical protein